MLEMGGIRPIFWSMALSLGFSVAVASADKNAQTELVQDAA
jgi:hypothetical protein